MISYLQPLPVGNAVRCLLGPLDGALKTRVLRKLTDTIGSAEDPQAAVVFEGEDRWFIDHATLANGTTYYYRAFDLLSDATWEPSESFPATPEATAEFAGPDPLQLLRDRIEAGLKVEVEAGRLTHADKYVPVLKAPPVYSENTKWPVVSVHLRSDSPAYRGVGEVIGDAVHDVEDDVWWDGEGWVSRFTIDVVGWSVNPTVRNDLGRALKKVVIGNLPVFYGSGLDEIEASFTHPDDTETYAAPVYMAIASVSCTAPSIVESRFSAIQSATVHVDAA